MKLDMKQFDMDLAEFGVDEGRTIRAEAKLHDRSQFPDDWPHEETYSTISCLDGRGHRPSITNDTVKITKHDMRFSDNGWWCDTFNKVMDPDLVLKVMTQKTYFDDKDLNEFYDSRGRTNPYEDIGQDLFINRAATKLLNMDHVFKLTATLRAQAPDRPLLSADVCAGPGGFTEYMFWRLGAANLVQYGMTLAGPNDFNMRKIKAQFYLINKDGTLPRNANRFLRVYGPARTLPENRGNVFLKTNVNHLARTIQETAPDYMGAAARSENAPWVDILTCDAGDDVSADFNKQELLSKRLVLCQTITALTIVRKGGSFVLKVFDCFSPFSVCTLFILYTSFRHFSIFKPVTSRPANSERYIVCRDRIDPPESVRGLLDALWRVSDEQGRVVVPRSHTAEFTDLGAYLPIDMIVGEGRFLNYLRDSNNTLGAAQLRALELIQMGMEDPGLRLRSREKVDGEYIPKKPTLDDRCLELWKGVDAEAGIENPFVTTAHVRATPEMVTTKTRGPSGVIEREVVKHGLRMYQDSSDAAPHLMASRRTGSERLLAMFETVRRGKRKAG